MPLFSVSGLRGVVGEDLTPDVILRYTHAYLSWLEEQGVREVLVGRDTRLHGPAVQALVTGIALYRGFHVWDAGVVPTPVMVWGARQHAAGGIVITASHNPPEWNALKFLHPEGRFPTAIEVRTLQKFLEDTGPVPRIPWDRVGRIRTLDLEGAYETTLVRMARTEILGNGGLQDIRVGVDAGGGATYRILPRVLMALGAQVVPLHTTPQGRFPRPPEPTPEALRLLDRALQERVVDVGAASDPDGDRMVFGVGGRGVISEEGTLPVAVDVLARLGKVRGPVVVNYSTSRWTDAQAHRYGIRVYRAPVGEANVLSRMREVQADIGGEGNGGVIWPAWNACRDGILAAVLGVVQYRDRGPEGFAFPERYRVKKKIPGRVLPEGIGEGLDAEETRKEDGVYLRWGETWVHVRPSNTEPVIRLVGESPSREMLEERVQQLEQQLQTRRVL